ncbi:hypothetical protein Vretimale_9918 [Volvox reticuliferus]|uniref:Uncharacterized protein n=1 Tax=Volvox reticuliferus TaxID=1737510 RepID=A0A8J4LQS7_9CHLO|nr:hypothetical protein Vretimale_9918 [Volvox reticuliferus]
MGKEAGPNSGRFGVLGGEGGYTGPGLLGGWGLDKGLVRGNHHPVVISCTGGRGGISWKDIAGMRPKLMSEQIGIGRMGRMGRENKDPRLLLTSCTVSASGEDVGGVALLGASAPQL